MLHSLVCLQSFQRGQLYYSTFGLVSTLMMVVETGNECGGEFIMNGGPYESLLAEVYNEATTSTASQRIKTYSPHHLHNGLTTQRVPLPISNGDEVVMAKRGSSSVHQVQHCAFSTVPYS